MADSEQTSGVCITRQPILDLKNQVFGYELLYRTGADPASAADADPHAGDAEVVEDGDSLESTETDHASSRVIADAVLALGLDALTSGKPAFVKFSRNLLLSDAATLLPAKAVVIELSGDIDVDGDVIDACNRLFEMGYALSLDDYTAGTDAEAALLSYVKFARVDVLQTSVDDCAALAQRLQPLGVQLIAKKVETAEMAAQLKDLGYKLFQGYYFCKPTKVKAKGMPERRLAYLNLLSALNREDITVAELEELVKHDVSLSVRVLRMINSAAYSLRCEVTSIRQALVLLGLDQIRKSASVWALAGANTGGTQEVVSIALLRARCCELVGAEIPGAGDGGGFFVLGLCSLLDAIVGKPLEECVSDMPLPAPIKAALLGEKNQERTVLDAVVAYEQGEWDASTKMMKKLKLKIALSDVYADALRWARELSRTAQAA